MTFVSRAFRLLFEVALNMRLTFVKVSFASKLHHLPS